MDVASAPSMGRARRITGWVLAGVFCAQMILSAGFKLLQAGPAVEMFQKWGLGGWLTIIGVGELVSTLLFLAPRTAMLGTLLLSSYLGGAIVTHMQHGEPFVSPAIVLVFLWITAAVRMPELLGRFLGRPV